MDKYRQISELLTKAMKKGTICLTGDVVSLQSDTCTVKLSTGMVLSGVRLKSSTGGSGDSIIIKPKIGSLVTMISLTGGLDDLMVIKVEAIDSISIKKGTLEVEVGDKVKVSKGANSIKSVLNEILTLFSGADAIQTSPVGPCTLNPTLAIEANLIKNKIQTFLD